MNSTQWKSMLFWGVGAGAIAVVLAILGNPPNMAICAACFVRDIAGSLGLHQLAVAQYLRPEIIGLILGASILSTIRGEYTSTGGASTILRFFLGMIMMIGALVFLGCPTRMVLRMAAGDLSAYVGLIGLVAGIVCGAFFLRRGFSLGRPETNTQASALGKYAFPAIAFGVLIASLVVPEFKSSESGPGSQHAPILISLLGGVAFGAIAQRTRMCYSGAFRDLIMVKNAHLFMVVAGTFIAMLVYQLASGQFALASYGPIAHDQALWNILGMYIVGFAAVLLGGCPLRQLVLSGQGSWDAAATVLGMLFGSAIAHNFQLAAAPSKVGVIGGPGPAGQLAVFLCIAILFTVAVLCKPKQKPKAQAMTSVNA